MSNSQPTNESGTMKATGQDKKDLTTIVLAVANYRGLADLADIAGKNGDTGLSGYRVRSLIEKYGNEYGIEYHTGEYHRGNKANSNYFGKCGSGFGGYTKAAVAISKELQKRIDRKRRQRKAATK